MTQELAIVPSRSGLAVVLSRAGAFQGGETVEFVLIALFIWGVFLFVRWAIRLSRSTNAPTGSSAKPTAARPAVQRRPQPSSPQAFRAPSAPARAPQHHRFPQRQTPEARWYPAGESVQIGGVTIADGLVYVGRAGANEYGEPSEPSFIDPKLPATRPASDSAQRDLGYWPSYATISASDRGGYLDWLASGRRARSVPIGYVFLFMYGLERRVIVDSAQSGRDLDAIRWEMGQLLETYGDRDSFARYGERFVDLLDYLQFVRQPAETRQPPALDGGRWNTPSALKLQIGWFAQTSTPVPVDWALAWVWYNPEINLRTPATRASVEFHALFRELYREKHGHGLVVKPLKRQLSTQYYAASSAIRHADLKADVPDVFNAATPLGQLRKLAEQAQDSLDSYSRYLGKNPDGRGTLQAASLLPRSILRADEPALRAVHEWAVARLLEDATASATELLTFWGFSGRDRLTKAESVPALQLVEKFGIGVEPDVRFGGPSLAAEHTLQLFEVTNGSPAVASPEYEAAQTLAHLAVAVSAADGLIAEAESSLLVGHIETQMGLSKAERVRLDAHVRWLGSGTVKLTGLTKRLQALSEKHRALLSDLLVNIVVADGVASPEEIVTVSKAFELLGLSREDAISRIHGAMTGAKADVPITVRQATPRIAGQAIPSDPQSGATFSLDESLIKSTMAETAKVSALLRDVFVDEEPKAVHLEARNDVIVDSGGQSLAGLDSIHSALLRFVSGMSEIDMSSFEDEARRLGVMPIGAIDTLNEAAFELADEPLLEGDDILTINTFALEEMLK